MRGYSTTKSFFPFGVPSHKYSSSSEDFGDYGASFYEVLCSWLSFRDFRPVGSIAEVEKIRNVFSTMFQANHKQMVKKHQKTKCKEIPHIVKIDLNKIDENLKLSNNEKRQLKRTLHQIKYREIGAKPSKKGVKRANNKSVVLRKAKKNAITDRNAGRNKKIQSIEKSKERLSWQRSECKHCSLCSKVGNESPSKWNKRSHLTNISSSEERIFKTLMNLDRSCCGESFKKLFDHNGRKTFITQKHNINIENLELKYIQPTCLIQYEKEELKKVLSDTSLEGHLGTRGCLKLKHLRSHDPLFQSRGKSMHYDDAVRNSSTVFISNPPMSMSKSSIADIIAENDTTEGKISTSTNRQRMQDDISGVFDMEKHIESLKMYRDKCTADSGTLEDIDERIIISPKQSVEEFVNNQVIPKGAENKYISDHEKPTGLKKNTSKCQKFKNFAKKCFCICGNENDSETDLLGESRRDREVGSVRLKKRLNSPDVKLIRMTEKEFLMSKERIQKQIN